MDLQPREPLATSPPRVHSPGQYGGRELAQFGVGGSTEHPASSSSRVAAMGGVGGAASSQLGGLTPPRSRAKGKVLMLTPGSSGAASRGDVSPGPNVMGLLKREIELLEAKLFAELDQRFANTMGILERSDKIRDMAIQRVEKKLADQDETLAKHDKKMAEASGSVRGVQEELLDNSRWREDVDSRLWEFRHQVEEEFRERCTELESQSKEHHAKIRAAHSALDDIHAKHAQSSRRYDGSLQDFSQHTDALAQALAQYQERLSGLENGATKALTDLQDRLLSMENSSKAQVALLKRSEGAAESRLLEIEQNLAEHSQKVNRLHTTAHGDGGWEARLTTHETWLTAMRGKLDSYDQHHTKIDEAVRQKWGDQISKLQKLSQETGQSLQDMYEKHEVLMRHVDTRHDALHERLQQLECQGSHIVMAEEVVEDELQSGQVSPLHQALVGVRAPAAAGALPRVQALAGDSPQQESTPPRSPGDATLNARVGELVSQLKAMVPQMHAAQDMVDRHDAIIRELGVMVDSHHTDLKDFQLRVQNVECSVKKLLEGSTNVVQLMTSVADTTSRGGRDGQAYVPAPELGENVDHLLLKVDDSESKILDVQQKLRQRVDNIGALLEAVGKKTNGSA